MQQYKLDTPTSDRLDVGDVEAILQVIMKLMNSLVVQLMKGFEKAASEKALAGYLSFHQLLLLLCEKYPILQRQVECLVRNFVENTTSAGTGSASSRSSSSAKNNIKEDEAISVERFRSKKHVPDLGEFLCLLSVSDIYEWQDLALPVFEESAARSIKWLREAADGPLQKLNLSPLLLSGRLGEARKRSETEKIFKGTVVGRRLLMFHCWFVNNVARKPHTHGNCCTSTSPGCSRRRSSCIKKICTKASCCLSVYERTKGIPSAKLVAELHEQVKEITSDDKIDTWTKFFARIGLRTASVHRPMTDTILGFYKLAEEKSGRLEYHLTEAEERRRNAVREKNLIRSILYGSGKGGGGGAGKGTKGKGGRR
eukprot:g3309.t1